MEVGYNDSWEEDSAVTSVTEQFGGVIIVYYVISVIEDNYT